MLARLGGDGLSYYLQVAEGMYFIESIVEIYKEYLNLTRGDWPGRIR